MRLGLALVHSSALARRHTVNFTPPWPIFSFQFPDSRHSTRSRVFVQSTQLYTKAETYRNDNHKSPRIILQESVTSRKRSLPSNCASTIPDSTTSLQQKVLQIFLRLILETSIVALAFALASIHFFARVSSKFVIKNLIRCMAGSLSIKLIMLRSWITSLAPSLGREERSDWCLQGTYRVLLLPDDHLELKQKCPSSVLVEVRQVPGNGSCLFLAVAAGILFDQTALNNNESETSTHPPMYNVIEYASTLRVQAVDTLENGFKSDSTLVMQNDESISTSLLVNKAAMEYGISSEKYLSKMRQANVWGGGPEIIALANSMQRKIILLEPISEDQSIDIGAVCGKSIYLKTIARFGPPSTSDNPIYILSTNQRFPKEYNTKKADHFLAVFPSRPL